MLKHFGARRWEYGDEQNRRGPYLSDARILEREVHFFLGGKLYKQVVLVC